MSETIISKACTKCKEIKPLSEFYKESAKKTGHRSNRKSICKICCLTQMKEYRQTEKGKAIHNYHNNSIKGKSAHKRYSQSEDGKIFFREKSRRYGLKYPERIKAKNVVNNTIQRGDMPRINTQQCHYCSIQAQDYHHHKDYAPKHWLDVLPVCKKCHYEIHSFL